LFENGTLSLPELFKYLVSLPQELPKIPQGKPDFQIGNIGIRLSSASNSIFDLDRVEKTIEHFEEKIRKIDLLNKAVRDMIDTFKQVEDKEEKILEIAIITFGKDGVKLHTPLTNAKNINFTNLQAGDYTYMGTALKMAKAMIEDNETIDESKYYTPAVVLVSDGMPNDDYIQPLDDFINNGRTKECSRFAVAIGKEANNEVLNKFVSSKENLLYAKNAKDIVDKIGQVSSLLASTKQIEMKKTPPKKSKLNINQDLDKKEANLKDLDNLDF